MSELPDGWIAAKLGDLGTWSSGGTPSRKHPEFYDGEIPWVKTGDLKDVVIFDTPEKISEAGLVSSSAKLFPAGSLLIAMYGATIGKTAVLGIPATTNQACAAFLPEGLSGKIVPFLWKYAIGKKPDFVAAGQGGAQPNISQALIKDFPIDLPPLPEQKRIVAKLDALATKSARARTDLARIGTLVTRYKQAVLSKAFSGELTSDLRKPSSDQIHAKITDPFTHTQVAPATWEQHVFSEVCRIVGGSQPPKSTFAYAPQEGHVRLVQIRDYKSDAKATYIPRELARRFCSETDIMIGRYGPPIFQILRGIEGAYNVALMKAEPTEAVDQEFLYWYLHHPILFRYVEIDSKRTAGQDGVNKAHLERWPILLPPLNEQREIVRRLEFAFQKIDRLAAEAKRALELVGKLDEAILAKAFKGQLVPQDPNDEPASVLLERIKAERAAVPKTKQKRRMKA